MNDDSTAFIEYQCIECATGFYLEWSINDNGDYYYYCESECEISG